MKKKRYEGHIEGIPSFKIYLNVTHLQAGSYQLKIIHKNRVIKKTTFKKNKS